MCYRHLEEMCYRQPGEGPAQSGTKRKVQVTKLTEQETVTQEVKRPRPSTKKTDILEEMIEKLSEKMDKLFEVLAARMNEIEMTIQAQDYERLHETLTARVSAIENSLQIQSGGEVSPALQANPQSRATQGAPRPQVAPSSQGRNVQIPPSHVHHG